MAEARAVTEQGTRVVTASVQHRKRKEEKTAWASGAEMMQAWKVLGDTEDQIPVALAGPAEECSFLSPEIVRPGP